MNFSRSVPLLLVALLLVAAGAKAQAAPPTINYFFPAGVQQRQMAEITASGTFSHWPLESWIDRPGLTIECLNDKGKLKVTAAEDASAGVYWVRLYDSEGASVVRPLIVGSLAEVVEQEPNNATDQAQSLAEPSVVNGRLEKSGDIDCFSLQVEQGQTLVASLTGNAILASPMDAVMQICDAKGFVLEQDDDSRGLDPQIAFVAPQTGRYIVRIFAFPSAPNSSINFAGAETYIYRLTITNQAFADHTLPLAVARGQSTEIRPAGWNLSAEAKQTVVPGDDDAMTRVADSTLADAADLPIVDVPVLLATETSGPDQPDPIPLPCDISGRLEEPGDVHAFQFAATKGKKIRFQVFARALLLPLDSVLAVLDSDGKVLSEVDDTGKNPDGQLIFTPPADGNYVVTIRDLHGRGGLRFVYRLTAEEVEPAVGLTLAADSFVLKPGEALEVAVAIDRRDGFDRPLEVTAVDLPEGVTVEPATSDAKGDSAKSVKLKLTAEQGVGQSRSGPFRIVGRTTDDTASEYVADFGTTDARWRLRSAWLTVVGEKPAEK